MIIAPEDVFAVKGDAVTRGAFDELFKANDARYREDLTRRAQHLVRIFNPLGDVVHEQRDGAFDRADVQRLVRRVQNQHPRRVDVRNRRFAGFVGEDAVRFVRGKVVVGGDASLGIY